MLFDKICREKGSTHQLTTRAFPTTIRKAERRHRTLRPQRFINECKVLSRFWICPSCKSLVTGKLHNLQFSCHTASMTENELGRRERKRLTTHQMLRSAALRLVAERGLAQVTVEDIAEEADVSVRTFYDHFLSKEDAIVGFDASRVDQLREALAARPVEESPLLALRTVLRELLAESSEEWPLRMEVIRSDSTLLARMFASFAISERAMIEVIASRTGTDADRDLFPALITAVATGAFKASINVWRSNSEVLALSDVFDAAFDLVGNGLSVPGSYEGTSATHTATSSRTQPIDGS